MKDACKTRGILRHIFLFTCLSGLFVPNTYADENSKYRQAIREFADNVLRYARETYGPKHILMSHSPLKQGLLWPLDMPLYSY